MFPLFTLFQKRRLLVLTTLAVSLTANLVLFAVLITQHTAKPLIADEAVKAADTVELLDQPLHITGTKEIRTVNQPIPEDALANKDTVAITYNLHGLCLLKDKASAVSLIETNGIKHSISLTNFGKNCFDGEQTVSIPLKKFPGVTTDTKAVIFQMTFWYPTGFTIDISSVQIYKYVLGARTKIRTRHKTTPTPITPIQSGIKSTTKLISTPSATLSPSITSTPTTSRSAMSWQIQSVSSMKETKDKICSPDTPTFVQNWVDNAKELGVNYISIETPYDTPACGDSVAYTKLWIDTIRSRGLHVWHRHMPLAFEGIYSTNKNPNLNYIQTISNYIKANPTFFKAGDIFTPIPEPQNGGISGVTYCSQSICIFSDTANFNLWLRNAMSVSDQDFKAIGLGGQIKIGYWGFDGFVTWGDNNPDWHGILEDATVNQMGNITIDHYPEIVGDTMQNDLNELQTKYPNTPIIIGEWGTISGGDTQLQVLQTMQAAKRPHVIGFNYWHMGMGGNEALINDDFTHKPTFAEVQLFFRTGK